MNANRQLSNKEWQLLSAFLDDQLKEKEKRQVEELLRIEPGAQSAMEGLRRTRILLKALPLRKASRNFTLSPESVKKIIIPTFTGILRYSSALAALLLVAVLAFDFLSLSAPLAVSRTAEDASPEMMAMEAPAAKESEQPPIIYWGAPPPVMGIYGKGGGGDGMGYGIGGAEGPAYGMGGGGAQPGYIPPEAPIPEAIQPSELLPPGEESTSEAAEEAVPSGEKLPAPESLTGSSPILGVRPESEQGVLSTPAGKDLPDRRGLTLPVSLRLVEIVLAILLVLTAIPAWLMRRK